MLFRQENGTSTTTSWFCVPMDFLVSDNTCTYQGIEFHPHLYTLPVDYRIICVLELSLVLIIVFLRQETSLSQFLSTKAM